MCWWLIRFFCRWSTCRWLQLDRWSRPRSRLQFWTWQLDATTSSSVSGLFHLRSLATYSLFNILVFGDSGNFSPKFIIAAEVYWAHLQYPHFLPSTLCEGLIAQFILKSLALRVLDLQFSSLLKVTWHRHEPHFEVKSPISASGRHQRKMQRRLDSRSKASNNALTRFSESSAV